MCGDPEYGTAGLLGLERQFLHATRLAFDHPLTDERVEVVSPLPADLARALALVEVGTGEPAVRRWPCTVNEVRGPSVRLF